jgi:hypothetical protein
VGARACAKAAEKRKIFLPCHDLNPSHPAHITMKSAVPDIHRLFNNTVSIKWFGITVMVLIHILETPGSNLR